MPEIKKQSSQEVNIIKRRTFLKSIAASISLAFFPGFLKGDSRPKETKVRSNFEFELGRNDDYFFQNIELYTTELATQLKKDLATIPEVFAFGFSELGLDATIWIESIAEVTDVMDRIKATYDSLGSDKDEDAVFLLQRDFRFEASKAWAVLRTKQLYLENPEQFAQRATTAVPPSERGYHDALIEDDILDISAPWANVWLAEYSMSMGPPYLGVVSIFKEWGGVEQGTITPQGINPRTHELENINQHWRKRNDLGSIPNLEIDPDNNRPNEALIILEDQLDNPDLIQLINKLLKSYGLDRAIDTVTLVQNSGGLRGSHLSRLVSIYAPDFSVESYNQNPETWNLVILHEVAHAIYEAIKFLPTDELSFKHRLAVYKMLKSLRANRSLEVFFQPKGESGPKLIESFEIDDQKSGALSISEASITQYSSLNHMIFRTTLNYLKWAGTAHEDLKWNDEGASTLFYRLSKQRMEDQNHLEEDHQNFSDFWQAHWSNAKNEYGGLIHPLEKEIITKIDENPSLFNADKRGFYKSGSNIFDYFHRIVIPMVVHQIILEDPKKFTKLYMHRVSEDKRRYMEHQLSFIIYEMRLYSNDHMPFYAGSTEKRGFDTESFAEIFQSAMRRNNKGVINEIPEQLWVKVDEVLNDLLADLKSNSLAQAEGLNVM